MQAPAAFGRILLFLMTVNVMCPLDIVIRSAPGSSPDVSPGFLGVASAGWRGPDVPARLGLGDRPPPRLLYLMAAATAGARIAGIRPAAVVVGDGMLEVRFVGWPGARWESALVVPDLDQAAEPFAWRVGADLMAVVAGVGGHDVEPHGQFSAAGQGEYPRVVLGFTCARGEPPVAGWGARARLCC